MSAGGVVTCRITLRPTPNTGPLQLSHVPLGSLENGINYCNKLIVLPSNMIQVILVYGDLT